MAVGNARPWGPCLLCPVLFQHKGCTGFPFQSVDILAQAISCSNVRTLFLRHELFWFCLVQVSTTQFCCFPPAFMACVDDGSNVSISPLPSTSSNFGSLGGSGPDLHGMGHRSYDAQFKELRDWYHSCGDSQTSKMTSKPSVTLWVSAHPGLPMSNRSSIPSLPRWSHLQRWNRMLTPSNRMSPLSLHACARSKQVQPLLQAFPAQQELGLYQDRLIALQPQGPIAQGHLTTAGTQDADVILSQTQMMKMLEVPFYCSSLVNNSMLAYLIGLISSLQRLTCPHPICRSGFIVKTGSASARLVFGTRATCQEFVARFKDDGMPCTVDSPFL